MLTGIDSRDKNTENAAGISKTKKENAMTDPNLRSSSLYDLWGVSKGSPRYKEEEWKELETFFKTAQTDREFEQANSRVRLLRRELVLPNKLGDLGRKDLSGFQALPCFFIELKHHFFPAIHAITKRVLICLEEDLAKDVAKKLGDEPFEITTIFCLVKRDEHYGFSMQSDRPAETPRVEILTRVEYDRLVSIFDTPFKWRSGLL